MTLRLAAPISQRDLERYAQLLHLASPQVLYIREAHTRYSEAYSSVLREHMAQLDALNAAASRYVLDAELAREGITHARVAATVAVYDMQDQIERELLQAENAFFGEMELMLAEPQRELLPRVRDYRARARCTSLAYRIIRESWIDLSALVDRVVFDETMRGHLDNVLREYEQALTPLTVELESELRKQDRSIPELLAWRKRDETDQLLPEDEQARRSLASIDMQRAIVERGAELQKQIATLNQLTLPKVLQELPDSMSTTLAALYKSTSFPAVYSDRFDDGAGLCDEAQKAVELTDAHREAIGVLCESFRQSQRLLNEEMEARVREWQQFYAQTRFTLNKYEPYRSEMRTLREKRWALTTKLARQIRSVVPAELAPAIHQRAANAERLIEYALEQARLPSDSYPGIQ